VVIGSTFSIYSLRVYFKLHDGVPVCLKKTYLNCDEYQCADGSHSADCTGKGVAKSLSRQWSLLVCTINAFQTRILNVVFMHISTRLNEWENHKTQEAFNDAFVIKCFMFKFVNSFCTLYYIAFFDNIYFPGTYHSNKEIKDLLKLQLITLFGIALFWQNLQEIGLPLLVRFSKRLWNCLRKESK